MTEHPEDLPWNDAPADSDAPLGSAEPDPAEVTGDEPRPEPKKTKIQMTRQHPSSAKPALKPLQKQKQTAKRRRRLRKLSP